jgi:hypothetical protein
MVWIQTFTGRQFFPLDPRAEDVDLRDIAHALSLLCRFNGHVNEFYSVAQHSIHVAEIVMDDPLCMGQPEGFVSEVRAAALLHDAHEAYFCDMASPIKLELNGLIGPIEARLQDAIHEAFHLNPGPDELAAIKRADRLALATEARDLMGPAVDGWTNAFPDPLPQRTEPMLPQVAEASFQVLAERLFWERCDARLA